MERLDGKSLDITAENVEKMKVVFPEVFAEGKVDFDKLATLLGEVVDEGKEKYAFTWKGKMDAIRIAQTRSAGTLRPAKSESVNFDTTQNLYIEGDNLEVLKLLTTAYNGKIKMIYIDPPYNTGKDFVYKDSFGDNIENYKQTTGQAQTSNPETSGRYHTDWLNMIYPRLKLARNLLTDDGVIFITIDDKEVSNLRKVCDEVFGEDNFINIISVKLKNIAGASGGGEDKRLKKNMEYVLIYAKDYYEMQQFKNVHVWTPIADLVAQYREEGVSWKYTTALVKPGEKQYIGSTTDGDGAEIKIYKRVTYDIQSVSALIKSQGLSEKDVYKKYAHCIFQTAMPQSSIRPRVMKKVQELKVDGDLFSIEYIPKSGKNKGTIYEQFYKGDSFRLFAWLRDVSEERDGVLYKKDLQGTFWDYVGETKNLTKEGGVPFPNGKKPIKMLQQMLEMQTDKDSVILDFFSGSATTAHAVMNLNAQDGGERKFICVQLPEVIDDDEDEVYQFLQSLNKHINICEIGKERIRRAGAKIAEENRMTAPDLDIGFKVFKLDSTNLVVWDNSYTEDEEEVAKRIKQQSLFYIKDGRGDLDLVTEIMLKNGRPLTDKITEAEVKGVKVYIIENPEYKILVCLQPNITLDAVEAMVKDLPPIGTFIFADRCFKDANEVLNTREILKKSDRTLRLF